jgi:glycosyltransferase involved in cell wall biosynthesis
MVTANSIRLPDILLRQYNMELDGWRNGPGLAARRAELCFFAGPACDGQHYLMAKPLQPDQFRERLSPGRETTHERTMPTATAIEAQHPSQTRVLIVNSTLHIGGAEQVAACLAERVGRRQFEVSACYLKEPGLIADQMWHAGVSLVPVPGLRPGRRDYLTSAKLRRLILARRIHVVHTHDIHGLIDGSICRLASPGLRLVHTFHFGNYPHRRRRHQLIEGALWRVPDAIVAVGHAQAASIREFYGIPEDRLRVIWNGVDDPLDKPEAEPLVQLRDAGVPVIASISTLIPQKGLEHLLDAAALLRQWGQRFLLVIAGDGGLREPLRTRCAALRLDEYVRFLGWVPQASDRLLPNCDIFVQSSLWEAMSIVVLEAMAAGKPMVVTAVGENPHVVLPGETGLVVPPADPVALAESLRRLLHDEDLRNSLGRAARARYEAQFTVRHMIEAYERLYDELVRESRPRA